MVPEPELTVLAIPGDTNEVGRVKHFKHGHEHVIIEGLRCGGGWRLGATGVVACTS
jgi:hypothetical protein